MKKIEITQRKIETFFLKRTNKVIKMTTNTITHTSGRHKDQYSR